ncbi:hypothetical protein QBC35DRAFT_455703 [Podospora australis]|uniref:Uncharacterized protein n=1 Tax=Podospora australis TaxID=1536484 RepID=A0AAN6WLX1_9PEZI|nr:hypothetical protein QBC35DRAFT_455703 [Podospora australis]
MAPTCRAVTISGRVCGLDARPSGEHKRTDRPWCHAHRRMKDTLQTLVNDEKNPTPPEMERMLETHEFQNPIEAKHFLVYSHNSLTLILALRMIIMWFLYAQPDQGHISAIKVPRNVRTRVINKIIDMVKEKRITIDPAELITVECAFHIMLQQELSQYGILKHAGVEQHGHFKLVDTELDKVNASRRPVFNTSVSPSTVSGYHGTPPADYPHTPNWGYQAPRPHSAPVHTPIPLYPASQTVPVFTHPGLAQHGQTVNTNDYAQQGFIPRYFYLNQAQTQAVPLQDYQTHNGYPYPDNSNQVAPRLNPTAREWCPDPSRTRSASF